MLALAKRILVIHAAELAAAASLAALLSLGGAFNGWLDVLAGFAPVWLVLMLTGLAITLRLAPLGKARRAVLGLCTIGAMSLLVEMAPDVLGALSPHAKDDSHGVKVLTMNMWVDNPHPQQAINSVIAAKPDIALLQETDRYAAAEQRHLLTGFKNLVQCKPVLRCGEMIATRWPVLASGFIARQNPPSPEQFGALWARVQTPGGPVTVMTTHFRWPLPPGPQARQFDQLYSNLGSFQKTDLILTADMNLPPWTFAMRGVERRLAPMTRRTFGVFTWPALLARVYKPSPLPILAIDHIFAGPSWRTVSVTRLPRSSSDHYGVVATLTRTP